MGKPRDKEGFYAYEIEGINIYVNKKLFFSKEILSMYVNSLLAAEKEPIS